jgi:trans-aconitate methyltransferase
MADRAHWDERYRTVGSDAASWFEAEPTTSLELLDVLGVAPGDSVIDVGGGASRLVDHLVEAGHTDVAVLDLSEVALAEARARIGALAEVTWINEDLLVWHPTRRWDVWHDRAVLHFLTNDDDRRVYVDRMWAALEPGGAFVIGTFAEDGPTECSALPVRRYRANDFVELLGDVDVTEVRRTVHRTPAGYEQPFNWIAGRVRRTTAPGAHPRLSMDR